MSILWQDENPFLDDHNIVSGRNVRVVVIAVFVVEPFESGLASTPCLLGPA
jgi:hypothetical protein